MKIEFLNIEENTSQPRTYDINWVSFNLTLNSNGLHVAPEVVILSETFFFCEKSGLHPTGDLSRKSLGQAAKRCASLCQRPGC